MMNQRGFTLLEMLVAISIGVMLVLAMGTFAANSISGSNQDYNKTLVLTNAKEAVGIVARQIKAARSVQASNSQADAHAPGAPGNLYSWSATAGTGATLILAVPSRTASGDLIYIDGLHAQLYTDDVIFYLDATSHKLYRRRIANLSAPGNAAITTCPPSSATASCPADADVVDDVANLSTNYLDANNNAVSSPSGTEAVQYTVTETRTISGRAYSGTYTTIASLRNK
jgi:prepilin-type N-terminal cleavage/methylation domain-containing protein